VLRDVREVDCRGRFLGHDLRIPVLIAPIGSLQMIEPGGAATMMKAAATFGTIGTMSSVTQPGRDVVARASDAPKMFQLYVRGDKAWVDGEVQGAIDAGFAIFCLTVDTAHYSRRERDIIGRWTPEARRRDVQGREFQAALSWDDVRRVKDRFDIPLVVKGIGTAEDAAIAVECGVDAIYVSNHGGRQLDHARGTLDVLPEIAEIVAGRAAIVLDGGVMRGSDVIKAIALGADAVAIGKLQGLGLGAGGAAGLVRVLELLENEMRISMALLGVRSLDELDESCVAPAEPVVPPHATSPYGMIELKELEYDR
jgi:isopentenyl diphosphate isomerase/L-lactate dehydrogenase-like FMN-dependent dehydrogenase